ncbi:DUF6339 family protein [Fusibacter sp. JL216-2]|uniref:DUF6339 family protein n=1 Tax=Fusibacter sp. JL216-2 TaxID=3071453 RepID=UPI003D328208
MKIRFVTEDGLHAIKSNHKEIFSKIIDDRSLCVESLFSDKDLLKDTPYEVNDFQLDTSQPKGKEHLTDFENIKRIYTHLKSISDSQASDERIWSAFTLFEMRDYMEYRWKTNEVNEMMNRYLFNYGKQRSLFRNGISRLWWIGRVTYDEGRENPFELTEFLCKNQDYIESICGRNVFNNAHVAQATISALMYAESDGIKIDRQLVRDIGKYLNMLAGTYIVDALTYEDVYDKVYKRIVHLRGKDDL